MKKFLLLLLVAMSFVYSNATETTWTSQPTTAAEYDSALEGSSGTTSKTPTGWWIDKAANTKWNFTFSWETTSAYYSRGKNGVQFGSSSAKIKSLKLDTENFPGVIKTVEIIGLSTNGSIDVSVSVGGTTYSKAATSYSYSGSSTGKIEIQITQNTSGKYISFTGLKVTYDPDDTGGETPTEKTAVTLSFPDTKYTAEKSEGFSAPKLTVEPAAAADAVSYSSSETSVATVNATGEVTLVGAGTTTITAAIADNATYADATASYELTVTETTQGGGEDPKAETVTATVIMNDQDDLKYGKDKTITWVSSDSKYEFSTIATITGSTYPTKNSTNLRIYNSNGNTITVNAPENCKIVSVSAALGTTNNHIAIDGTTCTNNEVYTFKSPASSFALTSVKSNNNNNSDITSMTFILEVDGSQPGEKTDAPISFSAESATGEFGDGVGAFTSEVPTFSNASNLTVAFDSSNKQVATVDASGNVTIVGVGETEISATFAGNDNYNKTTTKYTLTVTAKQTGVDPTPGNFTTANLPFDNDWQFPGGSEWKANGAYSPQTVEYGIATITFASASHQSGTITTCPVMKTGPITVRFNDIRAHKITFNFVQWSSKTKDITLEASTDGISYEKIASVSKQFVISSDLDPETKSVQITFGDASDQIGLASIDLVYEDNTSAGENPGLSFRYSKVVGKAGVGFAAQAAYHVSPGKVTYTSSNPNVVDVVAETGMFDINKPCNVGTTTITAEIEAAEGFAAAKATYEVEIEPVAVETASAMFNFNEPETLTPSYTVTSSVKVSDVTFTSGNVTLTGTKGSNTDCQLYPYTQSSNDQTTIQYRIYQGATLTIASTSPTSYITKIEFGFNSKSPNMGSFYRAGESGTKYGPSYSQQSFSTTADDKLTTIDFIVTSDNNVYLDYINVETTSTGGGDNHFVLSFNDEDRVISTFVGEKTELPELQIPTAFDKSAKITYSIDDPDAEGFDYTIAEENGKMFVTMHDEPGVYTLRASSEKTATQAASTAILRMNVFPTLTVAPASADATVDDARGNDHYNLTLVQPDENDNAAITLPSLDELTQTEEGAARYSTVTVTKVTVKVGDEVKAEYSAADNFAGMDTYTFEEDGVVEYTFQYGGTERFEHTAVVNVVMMPQKPATVADESTSGSRQAYIVTPSKNAKLQYYTYTAPKQSNKVSGFESTEAADDYEWITSDEPSMTFARPDDLASDMVFTAYYRSMKNISAIVPDDPELVSVEDVVNIAANGTLVGVEQVDADNADANAEVEYFDLQGRRVMNPANGLYIRKQGTTVEKVAL